MRSGKLCLALAAVVVGAGVLGIACTQEINVGAPTVVVGGDTFNGGGAPASPGPGKGGAQLVYGAKIAEFGERGPNPAEQNQRETRVGGVSDVTCSPTDVNGSELKGQEGASQLVAFKQLGGTGAGKFSQDGANAYNGEVACSAMGVVVLECTIRDVATGQTFAGGDGGNRNVPWSMNCVS